jgi:hypothetical protein
MTPPPPSSREAGEPGLSRWMDHRQDRESHGRSPSCKRFVFDFLAFLFRRKLNLWKHFCARNCAGKIFRNEFCPELRPENQHFFRWETLAKSRRKPKILKVKPLVKKQPRVATAPRAPARAPASRPYTVRTLYVHCTYVVRMLYVCCTYVVPPRFLAFCPHTVRPKYRENTPIHPP